MCRALRSRTHGCTDEQQSAAQLLFANGAVHTWLSFGNIYVCCFPLTPDLLRTTTARDLLAMPLRSPRWLAITAALFKSGDSAVRKKIKRRSWSAGDVRTLKSLARKKTKARKIAKTLKRTEGATRQKAFSLGVSLDARV